MSDLIPKSSVVPLVEALDKIRLTVAQFVERGIWFSADVYRDRLEEVDRIVKQALATFAAAPTVSDTRVILNRPELNQKIARAVPGLGANSRKKLANLFHSLLPIQRTVTVQEIVSIITGSPVEILRSFWHQEHFQKWKEKAQSIAALINGTKEGV